MGESIRKINQTESSMQPGSLHILSITIQAEDVMNSKPRVPKKLRVIRNLGLMTRQTTKIAKVRMI